VTQQQVRVGTVAGRVVRYAVILLVCALAEAGCFGAAMLCGGVSVRERVIGGLVAVAAGCVCLAVVWAFLPARWPRRPWYP
jgi:hypothetical protein